jgi:hypothetical protein
VTYPLTFHLPEEVIAEELAAAIHARLPQTLDGSASIPIIPGVESRTQMYHRFLNRVIDIQALPSALLRPH